MPDTWLQEAMPAPSMSPDGRRSSKLLTLSPLVERALYREVARRRDLRPHAQLGVAPDGPIAAIESAFARLRHEYDPGAFEGYGPRAMEAATEICELVRQAYERMQPNAPATASDPPLRELRPRDPSDETLRARETLRVAIERRLADADTHRHAGRTGEAIRGYESVLRLDRTHAAAREQLERLRSHGDEPTRARSWLAIFRRKPR